MKLNVTADRREGVVKYNIELIGEIDPSLVEMLELIGITDFNQLTIDPLTWSWRAKGSTILYV